MFGCKLFNGSVFSMILNSEHSNEIVRRLRSELSPTAIYVFGSQGKGTADARRSDVDLFILVPDDGEDCYRKSVRAYRSLRELPFPKDIVVRTEARFRERSNWPGSIEKEVAETGKKLFGK